jgi:hypothetical protein
MNKTLLIFLLKRWDWLIVAIIFFASLFLRLAFFEDFSIFKADQARDAYFVKEAYEKGPGYLTLLGPKGGVIYLEGDESEKGGTFHLGPFYYYLQYSSAVLFGTIEPWAIAFPDILMFAFSILLFYYFAGMFLSKKYALGSVLVYSSSFIVFQYSIFAWNPNQMFFWLILFAVGLCKLVLEKNEKKRNWWFLGMILSFMILSQLHFLAFFGLPILALVFYFLFRPKKIKFTTLSASVFLVILFYIPVLVSEVRNNFENSKRIMATITSDDGALSGGEFGFLKEIEKTIERIGEFFSQYLFFLNDKEIAWVEIFFGWMVLVLLISGAIYLIKKNNLLKFVFLKKGLDTDKLDIIFFLITIWYAVFFVFFLMIVEDLDDTRYFIVIVPIVALMPFVFIEKIENLFKGKNKMLMLAFCAFTAISVFLNFYGFCHFHQSIKNGEKMEMPFKDPRSGPFQDLITIDQEKEIIDYMYKKSGSDSYICYKNFNYQYDLPYKYLGELKYPQAYFIRFNYQDLYQGCSYFFIARREKGQDDIPKEIFNNFAISSNFEFKASVVFELKPKNGKLLDANKSAKEAWLESKNKDKNEMEKKIRRSAVYWHQL